MTNDLNKSPPKHTPLPWGNDQTVILWDDGDAYPPIADIITDDIESPERPLADAEFIVRACNSHYELLSALNLAHDYMHERHMNLAGNKRTCGNLEERQLNEKVFSIYTAIIKARER